MARTGFLIVIYQDINPSSPTYNQTREERTQDGENCPTSASAHWIEDTSYCELTADGMLTGYEITVYRDVEPLSPTYNNTRQERELNPSECEADSTQPNWQNIGEPFCGQTVYMPGGLMGNDGNIVQQQQDMNEYSPTADEIREIETQDLEHCPLPNLEPVWDIVSESCHLVMVDGQLSYDGTKDVVRVNTNQYSPTWNNNIPETANIQDPINCPTEIEIQYRWITVSGETVCVEYDKYSLLKKQQSTDGGQTWTDVSPLDTMTGYLIEANSEDCGYVPPTPPSTQYRWVTVSETYQCMGYDKYTVEKKQQSTDGGQTWTDVSPLETKAGEIIEINSVDCGYVPPIQYRWVTVSGQTECVGYDKYSVEKKQQSTDGGTTWTDVSPSETRTGSVIEYNSEDCGYPPLPIQYRWTVVSGEYVCVGYDKHTKEKKQQSTDGGTTWTDVVPSETRTGSLIEANSEDCGYVPPTPSYETQYLTFEAIDNCIFVSTNNETLFYSRDNGLTWNKYGSGISVTAGNRILWKGTHGVRRFSGGTGRFNVYGNIMSLQYGDNFIGQTVIPSDVDFERLFGNDGYGNYCHVISAENLILPATTLSSNCYSEMFYLCRNLTIPPKLPATTLTEACYAHMFTGCTSLTTAPALPATTLAIDCYNAMFQGCTSLTTAPELPATTLAEASYLGMFRDCTNLNSIKCLATDISADYCTEGWVENVSASGTFTKAASMSDWTTGDNGIPSGWTVLNQ